MLQKYSTSVFELKAVRALPEYMFIGHTFSGNEPLLLPLQASKGFIFDIGVHELGLEKIHATIQFYVLRTLLAVEKGYIKVSVIDIGLGATMQLLMRLQSPNVPIQFITEQNQCDKFLTQSVHEARTIEHNIINKKGIQHLSEFNQNSTVPKPYHLIVIPNFPQGLSPIQVSKLVDLMPANRSGVVLILGMRYSILEKILTGYLSTYNIQPFIQNMQRINVARNDKLALFNVSETLLLLIRNKGCCHLTLSETEINYAIRTLNERYQKETFTNTNQDFLHIPIGYNEAGERFYFSLGQYSKSYHVLVSGATGTGKSTLFNNIITQIAEIYSSDEIRLYLIDYKQAVEFDRYREHPNVELLHLDNTNYDIMIETLSQFVCEMFERRQLFVKEDVDNIEDYNASTPKKLHRKILIVDELGYIFETGWEKSGEIKKLLQRVAQQGRSYGLHLILCSQTFKHIGKLDDFKGQFNVRIGFRHEDKLDASPLGLDDVDCTKIDYYQIYCRTPSGLVYVPVLDNISKKSIKPRLVAAATRHSPIQKFHRWIIEQIQPQAEVPPKITYTRRPL
jgi:FtsK/SpoIIIE family